MRQSTNKQNDKRWMERGQMSYNREVIQGNKGTGEKEGKGKLQE